MPISPRNQIVGTVRRVDAGDIDAVVLIEFDGGDIEAVISLDAVCELGIREGGKVAAVFKASDTMFATSGTPISNLPSYNQLVGRVSDVRHGAVNGRLTLALKDGSSVIGTITNEAIEELDLEVGRPAVAVFRPADVVVVTP